MNALSGSASPIRTDSDDDFGVLVHNGILVPTGRKLSEMYEHPGSYAEYLSDKLVENNTLDPYTGKYMLQTFGQYNVGVLLVRSIQLYSLNIRYPDEYHMVKSQLESSTFSKHKKFDSIMVFPNVNDGDFPNVILLNINSGLDDYNIQLRWPVACPKVTKVTFGGFRTYLDSQ